MESLAEQKVKERELNMLSLSDYYAEKRSIESTLKLINTEFKKGHKAAYNVSEVGLLMFGDELMNTDKMDEALKVLKLNTELYPEGYRAFHYYGDCLLKLNKKDEAIKAYEQSLKINPQNSSAKKILIELKKT